MDNQFGARLRRVREEKKLSQNDLAVKIGASQVAVAMWESGARQPRYSLLGKLFTALSVKDDERPDWIADLTGTH